MRSTTFATSLVLGLACCLLGQAQGKRPNAEETIPGKTVTLKADAIPLSKALAAISEQTGVALADRRTTAKDVLLSLDLEKATFWQALDAVARGARCTFYLHAPDGTIALVDGAPPEVTPSYHGVFRTSVRRVDAARDFDIHSHTCRIVLNVAWAPSFEPFYLDVTSYTVTFADGGKTQQAAGKGTGQKAVHGARALEIDLQTAAPPRAFTAIQSLKGELSVIGPTRMMDVEFTKLSTPAQEKRNGVTVTLRSLKRRGDFVEAEVELDYPPGGPPFESFQTWLTNNRIRLQSLKDEKHVLRPLPQGEEVLELSSSRAHVRYRFETPLADFAGWKLVYRTPERIVAVTVPFELKDIPLP